jgi:hypothetical protein
MGYGRYLRRRGHTWFFRFRWPAALEPCGTSRELSLSLRTGDYRLALHRARLLRLKVEELMARFTPWMSKADAEAMLRRWIDGRLWGVEANRAETGGFTFFNAEEIAKMGEEDARGLDSLLR